MPLRTHESCSDFVTNFATGPGGYYVGLRLIYSGLRRVDAGTPTLQLQISRESKVRDVMKVTDVTFVYQAEVWRQKF